MKKVLTKKLRSKHEFQYLRFIKSEPIRENSVLVESTHARDFSGHIFYVTKYLANNFPELKVEIAIKSEKLEWVKALLKRHGINNVKTIEFLSKDYMKSLATSKYLINDTTFWSYFNKRPEQEYINIWHGTPLKCLGKDNELDGFGNVQKNFLAANYLVVSNEYTKEKLVASYNLEGIANTKVIVGPSPRNSVLFDEKRRMTVRSELNLANKKIYMYMPTYRDNGTSIQLTEELLKMMDQRLNEDEILFVKLHPFDAEKMTLDMSHLKKVKQYPDDYETYEFLTAVDVLITDYSSIMYDFLCTGRKVLLYTYDKDAYYSIRGLYEDIDDYPLVQLKTPEQLIAALHSEVKSSVNISEFKEKYISNDSNDGVKELINYIFYKEKSPRVSEYELRNNKDNVVFYAGALWDNGISRAFFNTIDSINLDEKNYILFLKDQSVKKEHKYKLEELKIPYILSSGLTQYTFFEGILTYFYLNTEFFGRKIFKNSIEKKIFKMYKLDYRRMFNSLDIKQFIHYTGFERSLSAMLNAISGDKTRTTAFYHTDMFEEYQVKKNINLKTLIDMYKKIDQLVIVNKELEPGLLARIPELKNIIVMDNFLGYKEIKTASEENIFSSLLGTPLQYGNVEKFSDEILESYGTKKRKLVNNKEKTLSTLKINAISRDGVLPYIDSHWNEFNEVINQRANEVLNLNEDFVFSKFELGHIFGMTKLRLINDLFDPNIKVFINIGRFDIQKGHERLINAFVEVNRNNPYTRLVIVAPHGSLKKDTIRWVRESGIPDKIVILGGMKNPYSLLRYCDAFIFTSLYEGLGLVVFEALAVGTDVITVDIPATTQGLTYGAKDPNQLPALIVPNDENSIVEGWLEYLRGEVVFGEYDFEKLERTSLESWERIIN